MDRSTLVGTCECGVRLKLDTETVTPAEPYESYPNKLFGVMPPPGTPCPLLKVKVGDETWFRPRGVYKLFGKSLVLTKETFEERGKFGGRAAVPLADVRGFAPIQLIGWTDVACDGYGWICYAWLEDSIRRLFMFDDFEPCAQLAYELTDVLWNYRESPHPFRGV